MNRDLHDMIGAAVLLEAQDLVATDTKTNLLDVKGFQSVDILVAIGALTGVDGSNHLLPVLQHSDTTADADFAAVDAADIAGAFTLVDATAEDSVLQSVGYVGSKRYVRVLLNYTGSGISAGIVGVYAVCGHARSEPAGAPTVTAAT